MSVAELQKERAELRRQIVSHVNEQLRQFKERTGVEVRSLDFSVHESAYLDGRKVCVLADLDIQLDL